MLLSCLNFPEDHIVILAPAVHSKFCVVRIQNRGKNKMATQGRNELCACGSRKKYKKCCGRFTLDEMASKLAAYAAANNIVLLFLQPTSLPWL